ncbi:Ubiquinone biosynthesis protein coq9, mitochondrial [Coemansia sp. RSA 1933]|nr:Ubiquinone biosynthesis protein coq9, mitochondrial [Coemansia sp. RSA 1933]
MNLQTLRLVATAARTTRATSLLARHCSAATANTVVPCVRHMSSSSSSSSNGTPSDSGAPSTKTNAHLEILDRALTKVNDLGWTQQAVISAANELGYSSMASGVAENGGIGLVAHFMDRALDETRIEVDDQLHEFANTRDKLRFLCRTRLRMTQPYIRRWPEAAALLAQNLPMAARYLSDLSSQMWYLADDRSTRIDWYARRSALAGVYLSTELYMCEDKSPGFKGTYEFLDRRFDDMDAAKHVGMKAVAFGEQFSRNLANIFASKYFM